MERQIPSPAEVYRFARRESTKIAAGVAGGGLASAPFLDGRLDKAVDAVGVAAFCYTAVRIYKGRPRRQNETKNNEPKS